MQRERPSGKKNPTRPLGLGSACLAQAVLIAVHPEFFAANGFFAVFRVGHLALAHFHLLANDRLLFDTHLFF